MFLTLLDKANSSFSHQLRQCCLMEAEGVGYALCLSENRKRLCLANVCMNTYLWDSNHSIQIIFLLLQCDFVLTQIQTWLGLSSHSTQFLLKAQ